MDSHSKWLNDVVAHCENGVSCKCFAALLGAVCSAHIACLVWGPCCLLMQAQMAMPWASCICWHAQVTIDFPIIADPSREIAVK